MLIPIPLRLMCIPPHLHQPFFDGWSAGNSNFNEAALVLVFASVLESLSLLASVVAAGTACIVFSS